MVENRPHQHSFINFAIGIGALLIGLSLVLVVALVLIHAAYMAWELYRNPETIINFAQSFKLDSLNVVTIDLNGLDPLRMVAWPFVMLIMLVQAKIGLWSIEAGARLLDTARRK